MFSSARSLARSLLMFIALVLLIATLIQPATFSHAQEDEPPPSPTAGPPQGERPTAPQAQVVAKSDAGQNDTSLIPAGTSHQPAQPAASLPDAPPVLPTVSASEAASAPIKPQATQPPNTFHVNIIASATATAD